MAKTSASKTSASETSTKTIPAKSRTAPSASAGHSGAADAVASARIKAPSFRLPREDGGEVSLQDYAGSKLVLFFYPRADTPGCTREAIDFTRLTQAFAAAGTQLLGVSADAPKAQAAFRNKHDLAMPLVSDEAKEMIRAYGAWGQKSMYGKTFDGIIRTTVLIDATGHIARAWRHVKVDGHAEGVLEAAQML